jgi:hypothetical protein
MPRAASVPAINRTQDDKVEGPIVGLARSVGRLAEAVLEQRPAIVYIVTALCHHLASIAPDGGRDRRLYLPSLAVHAMTGVFHFGDTHTVEPCVTRRIESGTTDFAYV